jgi:hypothetical protein
VTEFSDGATVQSAGVKPGDTLFVEKLNGGETA